MHEECGLGTKNFFLLIAVGVNYGSKLEIFNKYSFSSTLISIYVIKI